MTVALLFDAWKGATVAPTTHTLTVLPAKPGPKAEPTAANLIASLVHPERMASIWGVAFSPDGARLFAAGYPSGIVQIWDVALRKETRRIDTPRGYRGSADYALLTPDWKTLYVPVEKRRVTSFERDGKTQNRINYSGSVRVWDLASGTEKDPLLPALDSGPVYAKLAPGGRYLACVERPSYDASDAGAKETTVVWDLVTGKKWKLCEGYGIPSFAPDAKTVVVCPHDYNAKTSAVKLLDLATGKELATVNCPEKERYFSVGAVSPDGAVIAISLGGTKGGPLEKWFLDGRTLESRGKLIGKGDPDRYGWSTGAFTRDGKRYVTQDGTGDILVWDVAGQKLERTLPSGGNRPGWQMAVSADGRFAAVGWAPKADEELESTREPDPQDLPQPRVSVVDLAGKSPPRVLVCPHGYLGGLAFSPDGKMLAFGGAGAVHLFDLTK